MNSSVLGSNEQNIELRGWSEEEWHLEHDDYSSNVYSNYHDDFSGNSSDNDVYHKRTRMIGTQKYLRENYYHRIECITATFLAAFMLRRPLNNVALATTTLLIPYSVSYIQLLDALAISSTKWYKPMGRTHFWKSVCNGRVPKSLYTHK